MATASRPQPPAPRRSPAALLAGCCALLCAAPAGAADGGFTTFFASRPYTLDGQVRSEAVFYETLSLLTTPTDNGPLKEIRLVVHGWGRVIAGEPREGDRPNADLDALYLETRLFSRRVMLRAGRQMITNGAARNSQIDGGDLLAYADTLGLGVELFAGVPVLPYLTLRQSNFLGGGRLFWRHAFDGEVGLSFAQGIQDGVQSRQNLALDAWWRALVPLTVAFNVDFNLAEERLQAGRVLAIYQPFKIFQISADAQRTAPDLFLSRASIFSVFSNERRDEVGGEMTVRTSPKFTHTLEGHWVRTALGDGYHVGTKGSWKPIRFSDTTIGGELRILKESVNRFVQLRSFAIHRMMYEINVTGEVDFVFFDQAINGSTKSLLAQGTVGRRFGERWDALLALSFGGTPTLDRRTEVSARLNYRFGPGGR